MPDTDRERHYFQEFCANGPRMPTGAVSRPEPPDFLVGGVGVEITKYSHPISHDQQPQRARSALQGRIVRAAQKIFEERGGLAVYVKAHFSPWAALEKRSVNEHASALASTVESMKLPASIHEPRCEVPIELVPEPFAAISIYGSFDGKDALWDAPSASWAIVVAPHHVLAQINRKAPKTAVARTSSDQLYLVIVNDRFDGSEPVDLSMEAIESSYQCPFDRLFWLDLAPPKVTELRTTGPK